MGTRRQKTSLGKKQSVNDEPEKIYREKLRDEVEKPRGRKQHIEEVEEDPRQYESEILEEEGYKDEGLTGDDYGDEPRSHNVRGKRLA